MRSYHPRATALLALFFVLTASECGAIYAGPAPTSLPTIPEILAKNAAATTTLVSTAWKRDGSLVCSMARDSSGNVYASDIRANVILKLSNSGGSWVASVVAGSPGQAGYADGNGAEARFNSPTGIAVDGATNIYVADNFNFSIRKITPDGTVTTLAGNTNTDLPTGIDGNGTNATFGQPYGLALDAATNLYVTDDYIPVIRRITPAGTVTTLAGNTNVFAITDGIGSNAAFGNTYAIAVDAATNVYVGDSYNGSSIRKMTLTNGSWKVITLAGNPQKFGATVSMTVNHHETIQLKAPIDGIGTNALFGFPLEGLSLDAATNLYVTDATLRTFRKVTPSGVVTTLAGNPVRYPDVADGIGTNATFHGPSGVVSLGDGSFFVADDLYGGVRLLKPALDLGKLSQFKGLSALISKSLSLHYGGNTLPSTVPVAGLSISYFSPSGNMTVSGNTVNASAVTSGKQTFPLSVCLPGGSNVPGLGNVPPLTATFGVSVSKVTPTVSFLSNSPASALFSNGLILGLMATNTGDQTITFSSSSPTNVSVTGSNAVIRHAGAVNLTASVPADAFYNAASVTRALLVSKASQTITFPLLGGGTGTITYGTNPIPLGASSSAGIAVSYASSVTNLASVSGTNLTTKGVGTLTLSASNAGSGDYLPATASQTLVIAKAPQTLDFPAPGFVPIASGTVTLKTNASSGLPVSYVSSDTNVASISGNRLVLKNIGSAFITASQPGNSNYLAADPVTNVVVVYDRIDYTGRITNYVITNSGTYALTVAGAQGGTAGLTYMIPGGTGEILTATGNLTKGTVLKVVVGGQGGHNSSGWTGGGGGGTFVYLSNNLNGIPTLTPLLVSGGGGGGGVHDGFTTGGGSGVFWINGTGVGGVSDGSGGGGAGFFANGGNGNGGGGLSATNGFGGGGGAGGFGGGGGGGSSITAGSGGGGGGGYNGGNGGNSGGGSGGGSYFAFGTVVGGTNYSFILNSATNTNSGNGYILLMKY